MKNKKAGLSIQLSARLKLILLAFFSLFLSSCGTDYSDPEAVANSYVDAVYYGSVKDFKLLVEEKDHRANQDHRFFVDGQSSGRYATQGRRGGITSIQLVKSHVGKRSANFNYKILFKDKTQKSINISLHLKEQRWYVDPMRWTSW